MNSKGRPKITVGTFHVVGGGCFGSQYGRWLLRAHQLGWLDFEKIHIVDHNPQCDWARLQGDHGKVQLVCADWVDYFVDLMAQAQDPAGTKDHWVPAPLSPHILFEGFIRAAGRLWPGLGSTQTQVQEDMGTPVQIPLDNGSMAVSFAEWQCPVNCIEPKNCPAIHRERDWDMKDHLRARMLAKQDEISSHVLQCQHLLHGVGTIPLQEIFGEFNRFSERLKQMKTIKLRVATVSGCHGLIAQASLKKDGP